MDLGSDCLHWEYKVFYIMDVLAFGVEIWWANETHHTELLRGLNPVYVVSHLKAW